MSKKNDKLILKLARLADDLDRLGMVSLADKLDMIISDDVRPWQDKMAQILEAEEPEELEVEIPMEEKEMLEHVLKSLQESLK